MWVKFKYLYLLFFGVRQSQNYLCMARLNVSLILIKKRQVPLLQFIDLTSQA